MMEADKGFEEGGLIAALLTVTGESLDDEDEAKHLENGDDVAGETERLVLVVDAAKKLGHGYDRDL